MSIFKIKKKVNNYAQIDNDCLRNGDLSFKAKGILCYLLSKPNDWEVCISDLSNHSTDGRDSIRAGLKELKEKGYALLVPEKTENGRFAGKRYLIFECPITEEEDLARNDGFSVFRENRLSGKPSFGKSNTNNKEITNKEETTNKECLPTSESFDSSTPNQVVSSVGKTKKTKPAYGDLVEQELKTLTEDQKQRWQSFQTWFKNEDFTLVSKIEDQLTPKQLTKLLAEFQSGDIVTCLQKIDNYKRAAKNYQSVYKTVLNWLRKDAQQNQVK